MNSVRSGGAAGGGASAATAVRVLVLPGERYELYHCAGVGGVVDCVPGSLVVSGGILARPVALPDLRDLVLALEQVAGSRAAGSGGPCDGDSLEDPPPIAPCPRCSTWSADAWRSRTCWRCGHAWAGPLEPGHYEPAAPGEGGA